MKMDLARASLLMRSWPSYAVFVCLLGSPGLVLGQATPGTPPTPSIQRIPGHIPRNAASVQGTVTDSNTKLGIPGVKISLLRAGVAIGETLTNAEGIFRLIELAPGTYELKAEKDGFQSVDLPGFRIKSPETKDLT